MQPLYEIIFTQDAVRFYRPTIVVPGIPYYATTAQMVTIAEYQERAGVKLFDSDLDPEHAEQYVKRWKGEDLNGKRLGYHHSGRLGDELVHTSAYRQLKLDYPGADIHTFVTPPNQFVGASNKDLGMMAQVMERPLSREEFALADYWLFPRDIGMWTRQYTGNIYRALEWEIMHNIDVMRPYVFITDEEWSQMRQDLEGVMPGGIPQGFFDRLIVVQINSTDRARTPDDWYERLRVLSEALPGYYVAVCGDAWAMNDVLLEWRLKGPIARTYFFVNAPGVTSLTPRGLLALVREARLVIAPDSFLMHGAAAWQVPCLALWNMEEGAIGSDGVPLPAPIQRIATYTECEAVPMNIKHGELAKKAQEIIGG